MAADDDDRDVTDAQYAELRRFVPAHARTRTPQRTREESRIGIVAWLGALAHALARKLRRV